MINRLFDKRYSRRPKKIRVPLNGWLPQSAGSKPALTPSLLPEVALHETKLLKCGRTFLVVAVPIISGCLLLNANVIMLYLFFAEAAERSMPN